MADFRNPTRSAQGRAAADISLYFEAFLTQCWRDGNRRGRHLFHDIKHRGYTGSFSNLEHLLAIWRRAERPGTDKDGAVSAWTDLADKSYDNTPVRDPQTGHLISPVNADNKSGAESRCPQTGITHVYCSAQLFHAISRYIS
ncbi:hypothetical protein AJ87_20135 [Rhizobium yanglingense]|nr:hypothetical protein AJ87_20135 [Rhizobium yanglingense]